MVSNSPGVSAGVLGGVRGSSTLRAPLAARGENKSTKTGSAWGGKVADLSKEKNRETFPQWAFIRFNLHRNTGPALKVHQSLSRRNDQIIDNIQRCYLRAYSESGTDS